jgi:hypothetical protein
METSQNSGGASGDDLSTMIAQTVVVANQLASQQASQGDTGGDNGGQQPPPAGDTPDPLVPTNTPLPTNTPAPTPTNTPNPTPTSPAGDPAVTLGSPDWTHNFNQEYPWHTYTSSTDKTEITGGKYYFRFYQNFNWPIWAFAAEEIEDYYLQINVKMPSACAGKDSGGLIFGSPVGKNNEGYVFRVSCDGNYRLTSFDGTNTDVLVSWSSDPAIQVGPDQVNRLGVMVNGNHITLYINGVKVDETNDALYTSKGRFGLAAAAPETSDLVITFDNAAYWLLP